jgi:hypothetical protein
MILSCLTGDPRQEVALLCHTRPNTAISGDDGPAAASGAEEICAEGAVAHPAGNAAEASDSDPDIQRFGREAARVCEGGATPANGGFVEQKNGSVVRRAAGYARDDTEREIDLLNELYRHLRLYTSYFQPSIKLISKERVGARGRKHYDTQKTPSQRLLASRSGRATPDVPAEKEEVIERIYRQLDIGRLKEEMKGSRSFWSDQYAQRCGQVQAQHGRKSGQNNHPL